MKKLLCVAMILLLVGCSVPGAYMEPYNVKASTKTKNRLLNAKIIPLNSQAFSNGITQDFNAPYEYRVGSYDVLSVVVWNHPELSVATSSSSMITASSQGVTSSINLQNNSSLASSPTTGIFINTDGYITLPLIGDVKVAGLTTRQVQHLVTQKLSKFIRHPQVIVQVIAFNSQRVHVIGEVMQPGVRPLTDRPLTILDAINLCGGINPIAADASNIYVLRLNSEGKVLVYWLRAKSPQELLLAERFRLRNNDILYVAPAGFVSWSRAINQILPTIQTIWYTQALFKND